MTSTAKLAKHYDALTPEQRLSAVTAAVMRGDMTEAERLKETAPKITIAISHTVPHSEAFTTVAYWQRAKELELCGLYLNMRLVSVAEVPDREKYAAASQLFGYLLNAHRDGWRRFCDSLALPFDYFHSDQPGGELLRIADIGLADRSYAPPWVRDEALMRIGPDAVTAESVAENLRRVFDHLKNTLGG